LALSLVVVTVLAFALDWWAPKPIPPSRPVPLITLEITPSVFPVSAAPHSALSLLPLHPYQAFTEAGSELHTFNNPCGEDRFWPSEGEISSKPKNGYEEVRELNVANHSQVTMETGKLVFRLSYSDSFGGGCVPPTNPTYQHDVVSIPALDPGRSFQFFAVNQTNRCVWLSPPETMTARMTGDEGEEQVPLKLQTTNVPNWVNTPFPPTTIQWQGVPIKNPGYGIVRTTANCEAPLPHSQTDHERSVKHGADDQHLVAQCYLELFGQVIDGTVPGMIVNQTIEPMDDVRMDVAQLLDKPISADDPNPNSKLVGWQKRLDIGTCRARLSDGLSDRFPIENHDHLAYSVWISSRYWTFRETIDLKKKSAQQYSEKITVYRAADAKPLIETETILPILKTAIDSASPPRRKPLRNPQPLCDI